MKKKVVDEEEEETRACLSDIYIGTTRCFNKWFPIIHAETLQFLSRIYSQGVYRIQTFFSGKGGRELNVSYVDTYIFLNGVRKTPCGFIVINLALMH